MKISPCFSATLLNVINKAVTFMVYEFVRSHIEEMQHSKEHEYSE